MAFAESLRRQATDPEAELARSHVLLKGRPAAAKTTLLERLKRWYDDHHKATNGRDDEVVTFIDLPTATKAGPENWLLERAERDELAPIVVLEEVENSPLWAPCCL